MAIAVGVAKRVVVAKESTFGTLAAGSGQELRRVQSTLNLNKEAYQSNEILTSQQIRDLRHGVRRVGGNIAGQISPNAYSLMIENLLRRSYAAVTGTTGATVTAANSGRTFTRSTGSWITDGFRVGMVVRFSGFTGGQTGNNARNYRIKALTTTIMTVGGSDDEVIADVSNAPNIDCAAPGKVTYIPATGALNESLSFEHWFSDLTESERFLGCKVQSMSIQAPPSGIVPVNFQIIGQDMATAQAAAYGSPTAMTTDDAFASVSGAIWRAGTDLAVVTGMQFAVQANLQAGPVVGSNKIPDIFRGTISVAGALSAYFSSVTLRDEFIAESTGSVNLYLKSTTAVNSPFMVFHMPKTKLSSSEKGDADTAIMQQFSFAALENTSSATNEQLTSIMIQDSAA